MWLLDKILTIANRFAADHYRKGDWGKKSEALAEKFTRKENKNSDFLDKDSRQQSLKTSQGKSDFSGSSYNGPGNVDREKRHSNMSQRNF